MTKTKGKGSLSTRLLRRLDLSPVPVRTAVLVAQAGSSRGAVWASLLRLQRLGLVARTHRREPAEAVRCPCCGRYTATDAREAFWERVRATQTGVV